MFPMDRKRPPILIEYDARGKRVTKSIDAVKGRSLYVRLTKEGRNPKVLGVDPNWKG